MKVPVFLVLVNLTKAIGLGTQLEKKKLYKQKCSVKRIGSN